MADTKELSIEGAFEQIRELLGKMEQQDISLEDSFSCYEQGMKLIRYCNEKIDTVEKKVQTISEEGVLHDFQ